jgi:hypothetical protein
MHRGTTLLRPKLALSRARRRDNGRTRKAYRITPFNFRLASDFNGRNIRGTCSVLPRSLWTPARLLLSVIGARFIVGFSHSGAQYVNMSRGS